MCDNCQNTTQQTFLYLSSRGMERVDLGYFKRNKLVVK